MHGPPSLIKNFRCMAYSLSRVGCIFKNTCMISIGVLCVRALHYYTAPRGVL